jgi:hypothetical protein
VINIEELVGLDSAGAYNILQRIARVEDLERIQKTLDGIINSAVHPDIAVRAVMVELKPIRNECERVKALIQKFKGAEPQTE